MIRSRLLFLEMVTIETKPLFLRKLHKQLVQTVLHLELGLHLSLHLDQKLISTLPFISQTLFFLCFHVYFLHFDVQLVLFQLVDLFRFQIETLPFSREVMILLLLYNLLIKS